MLAGNPDKFAFLIEKVSDWSSCGFTNGLMYVYINGKGYPEEIHTSTLNMELHNLTQTASPLVNPVTDTGLFNMNSEELFGYFINTAFENDDYRYQLPLQEIGDAGFFVFAVAAEDKVKIQIVKQKSAEEFELADETVVLKTEYSDIATQVKAYKEQL